MPKGKGYTPGELQTLRDEGVLSPSEIDALSSDNSSRSGLLKGKAKGAVIGAGSRSMMTPLEIKSRGYKYFPDNP